ncbi:MAG TPA: 3-methyl-2-oxobutanoate hydroxymethyltransferase [Chloroflexota bacterium]|nr:3-methyl-2-oxobutanoate hydroxymethyltransferase [Chloroflexota bacterium]
MARVTPADIRAMKRRGERIPMLTAYDYPTARILDAAGIPLILVGDSLGTAVLGYETTIPVTVEDIIHHTRAVVRGTSRAMVIADMPFMSYHPSQEQALRTAGRLLQEGGAQAVKLEGGAVVADTVRRLVDCGIPVQGHLGLTPQSVYQLGGHRLQGKTEAAAQRIIDDARSLEQAGVFSLVLELVPAPLARTITETIAVPTIGIGAGPYCDGQVQVLYDLLGMDPDFKPRHVRRFANLAEIIRNAVCAYAEEVRAATFPGPAESFGLDAASAVPVSDEP